MQALHSDAWKATEHLSFDETRNEAGSLTDPNSAVQDNASVYQHLYNASQATGLSVGGAAHDLGA